MIVVMRNDASQEQLDVVIDRIEGLGYKADVERGEFTNVVAVIGDTTRGGKDVLEVMPAVERVIPIMRPYKQVSRESGQLRKRDTVIHLNDDVEVGGKRVVMMVGPCSVAERSNPGHPRMPSRVSGWRGCDCSGKPPMSWGCSW